PRSRVRVAQAPRGRTRRGRPPRRRRRAAPGGADLHPWNAPRSTFAVRQGTCGVTPPRRLATLAAHVTEGPVDDSQQRKAIARALLAADVSDVDEDALVLAGARLRAPAKAAAALPVPSHTRTP